MTVVLDTNVVVSGLLSAGGNCALILDLVLDGQLTLAADDRILNEYGRVCIEPRLKLDLIAVRETLNHLAAFAERLTAIPMAVSLPDPDDHAFLEVAATARAVLVTGNKKHFPQRHAAHVQVVNPAEFLALLRESYP